LLAELETAGAKVKADGREILCPFHEDKHPSGGVYQREDGTWSYKCHAASCGFCGDVFDVVARSENKPVGDVLKDQDPKGTAGTHGKHEEKKPLKVYESVEAIVAIVPGNLEARYSYTNPVTRTPDLVVLRYRKDGKKAFWQVSPRGTGWVLQRPAGLLPLYNRIEVSKSPRVVVVEGEKCVQALRDCGHVGTTSPMGAGKASYADWAPLAGKTVYLWPDNDDGGIKHMEDVASILDRLDPPCRVGWIDPRSLNLPPKGDVYDFTIQLVEELQHEAVETVLESAAPMGAARELAELLEDTISGKRTAVSWPWPALTDMSKALLPGTVTLFCGSPGASKSFAILQAMRHWYSIGVKAVVFELEEDRAYHLNRLLAQECENGELTEPDWVRSHPQEVRQAMETHAVMLNEIGRRIYSAPEAQVEYKALIEWTQLRAKEGNRVIVIDPVTAVAPVRDVWLADSEFLFRIKTLAREHQCSILLVTHPRKGSKGGSMDDLAGGAAFQRFSQTLLWLDCFKSPKSFAVKTSCGRMTVKCNRSLHLFKCRNGRGTGSAVAMNWMGSSLKLAEQGIVISEKKQKDEPDDDFARQPGEEG
jgi:hypothetical protein